jgi:hypothetical protein
MSPAGNWSEESSTKFQGKNRFTYIASSVALECAAIDLHNAANVTTVSINSSALGVACPPPGIGAKKVQEGSEISEITYSVSAVALECAAIDLHNAANVTTVSINSSALGVACPPPGIGAKKVQESSET